MINDALLISLLSFAFVTAITPGPNNLMLMSSVMLFGVKRTLPHMAGIQLGFSSMMITSVWGLGELLQVFPEAKLFVKYAGAAWLFWLGITFIKEALRQHVSRGNVTAKKASRPFRMFEAALFQLANPKALIMVLSSAALYVDIAEDIYVRTMVMVFSFMVVGIPSGVSWMLLGRAMNKWLGEASHGRVVNIIMALLIFGLVIMILLN